MTKEAYRPIRVVDAHRPGAGFLHPRRTAPTALRQRVHRSGNPDGLNGQFQFNTFLKQVAVGAGAGIRIDVQFFVIRLDAAYPLIYPYQNVDFTTATGDTFTKTPSSIKLNIEIGYPF